ncbi:MAG: hypothetical protein WDN28_15365 [Chthoniobacter sp.]
MELNENDRKTLLAFAAKFGGGLSQGWREALRRDELSRELTERYIGNARSKSYVPQAVREALGNDLKLLDDLMHGPRQARLGGAYISRDPNTFAAGDWMQGDDCTLPVLYYEETLEGVRLMRGQFLAMIDVRTTYILGFVLISAPQDRPSTYNAWHIRNLITTVHEIYGLPREGFYFENGSWRAKVLTGNFADQTGTETGLREFGLRFRHARLPRAKVVERVFGSLQNTMEAEPGYVGRGWHNDKYERTERAKRFAESGKLPAGNHFYDRDQWVERLTHLVQLYNEEPQGGKYCDGLSPKDAYEKHFGEVPLLRLPDSARYLLANERKSLKVGRNGIGFRAGGVAFTYKSVETGSLIGRQVEVFFNRESPDLLGVKHPDSGEVFAVRRAASVPAMDADDATLSQAFAENEAHDSYKRALYRAIRPKFSEHFLGRPIFRPTLIDTATVEAGRQFAASAEEEKKAASTEQRLHRRTAAAAQKIGMRVRPRPRSRDTDGSGGETRRTCLQGPATKGLKMTTRPRSRRFHQIPAGTYMSSPEMQRGLLANCVSARVQVLTNPLHRKLIWWLQKVSWQPGGLEALAADLIQRWPLRFATTAMQRLGIGSDRIFSATEVEEAVGSLRSNKRSWSGSYDLRRSFPLRGELYERMENVWRLDDEEDRRKWSQRRQERANALRRSRTYPTSYPASDFLKYCLEEAEEGLSRFLFEKLCLDP